MTERRFWDDPYLTILDTTITSVVGNEVTVAATIFFAFSGGQESDAGTIAGGPVLQARKDDRQIVYTLAEGHGLRPGDAVRMEIDWNRRYRLMRLHFAAELVLELVCRHCGAIERIGSHIAQDKSRIDFAWPQNISPLLPVIETEVQAVIDADSAIECAFSDRENLRRYWQVNGFARVPCGGTHPHRTGEVGGVRLKRRNIGGGKERIEIYLNDMPAARIAVN